MNRRCRLDLAYDGTEYAGWQMQRNAPTVQGTLGAVLTRLNGDRRVVIHGAGRTDSGVHARAQVCDFEIDSPKDDAALSYALSLLLPPDIRPLRLVTVDDEFHSQYSAKAKSYRYFIDRSRYGDPLRARFALHYAKPLDLEAMQEALRRLPGRKDWSGFAGSKCTVLSKVRDLTQASYLESEGRGEFEFRADGFLTYMVRNIVGTMLYIGAGRLKPAVVEQMLETKDRSLGGPGAPPHGLHLWEVEYDRPLR